MNGLNGNIDISQAYGKLFFLPYIPEFHDVSYLLLTREDIPYIATNPDYVCPTEFGAVPDCGSVCDMIYNTTKKRPVVIGMPSPLMPELAMEQWGFSKEETAVIGDRIYTDVKFGIHAGTVDEAIVESFLNLLPPASMEHGYLQVGEAHSTEWNEASKAYAPTFMTFQMEDGKWYYRGYCFHGGNQNRYRFKTFYETFRGLIGV